MNSGQLVPDSIILDMMKERLTDKDCDNGFILDGFPRTIPQAEGLDYLLKSMKEQLDHVIVMDVPDNLIIKRLSNRRSCKECGQVYNLIFEPQHCNYKFYYNKIMKNMLSMIIYIFTIKSTIKIKSVILGRN